ncbi:MAG: hypothetical protein VXY37_07100 [Bacteroidota bacterium]|nr:hypothetical protein [Bacteroidota bacterium]
MKNIQLLLAAMFISLGVLAQAPQIQRNLNFSDNGSVDILTLDPILEKSFPLANQNGSYLRSEIETLLRLNEKSINDIKSFVCRNYPTTFNNGTIGYENKVFISKDNINVNLRLGVNSLHVVSSTSSSTKTLAIPYSSILFYSLENDELKVTLYN